jgi:hypothetical protein
LTNSLQLHAYGNVSYGRILVLMEAISTNILKVMNLIGRFSLHLVNIDSILYSKDITKRISFDWFILGYYHQVSSYGTHNLAVALLFSRFEHIDELNFSDCNKPLRPTPLSEMDVDWKYSGHGNLSMGNTDLETVR